VDFVIDRFTSDAASQSLLVDDASDYVRSVLKRALGDDKAALLIDRIMQGGDISGIESLKWMDPLSVAELLRGEHPQIVAAILVHLEYEQAAAVLMQFPDRARSEVMLRVATLEGIQPTALKDLNEVLFKVLAGGDKVRKTSLGGVKTAAEMLNQMGGNADVAVLDTIRNYDPEPGAEDHGQDVRLRRPGQARRPLGAAGAARGGVRDADRGAQGRLHGSARQDSGQYVHACGGVAARGPGRPRPHASVRSGSPAEGNPQGRASSGRRRPGNHRSGPGGQLCLWASLRARTRALSRRKRSTTAPWCNGASAQWMRKAVVSSRPQPAAFIPAGTEHFNGFSPSCPSAQPQPEVQAVEPVEPAAPAFDEEQLQQMLEQARAEGHAQGWPKAAPRPSSNGSSAWTTISMEQAASAQRVDGVLQGLEDNFKQLQSGMAQELLNLACDIARQVVRQELRSQPQALLPVIREALDMLVEESRPVTVRLNPADFELLTEPCVPSMVRTAVSSGWAMPRLPRAMSRWSRAVPRSTAAWTSAGAVPWRLWAWSPPGMTETRHEPLAAVHEPGARALCRACAAGMPGPLTRLTGMVLEASGLRVPVGSQCHIHQQGRSRCWPRWWVLPASAPF
jgi:flagellar biosynthesis/type III secretory pathway protein FliH